MFVRRRPPPHVRTLASIIIIILSHGSGGERFTLCSMNHVPNRTARRAFRRTLWTSIQVACFAGKYPCRRRLDKIDRKIDPRVNVVYRVRSRRIAAHPTTLSHGYRVLSSSASVIPMRYYSHDNPRLFISHTCIIGYTLHSPRE